MDGVGDGVHQLATNGRTNQRCFVDRVVHLTANINGAIEKWRRDRLASAQNALSFRKRELAIVFNPRVARAMIVIHFVGIESVQQALEVIETMPIMPANGRIERRTQLLRVLVVVDLAQERLALAQNFRDSGVQRRAIHR